MGIYDKYVPMRKVIPPGRSGRVAVEHFTVSEADAKFSAMRAAIKADRDIEVPAGEYVRLVIAPKSLADKCLGDLSSDGEFPGDVMMSDTQMEQNTNIEFLIQARGRVLVAGLGLGMVLIPTLKKDLVESIQVLELSPDVIKLVEPHLRKYLTKKANKKLTITQADIFEWNPQKGEKWDTIYFDIWADSSEENLEQVTRLKRKFARRLNRENPDAWMGAWKESDLRYWRNYHRRRNQAMGF